MLGSLSPTSGGMTQQLQWRRVGGEVDTQLGARWTAANVVFYKCFHFLFLITTCAVISCSIHHDEGARHTAAKRHQTLPLI